MSTRERSKELEDIKKNGGKLYSISKCNTINNCTYEAFLQYVLNQQSDESIYGVMGTAVHDKLEQIINGKASESELITALSQDLDDAERLGLQFPKDKNGNDAIRDKWLADMMDFCNTFKKPEGNFSTEELFIYHLGDNNYINGYIDLIKTNDDGSIDIYDWKTSSNFSAADLKHHGRQLAIYKIAKEAQGYKVNRTAWIMLKYLSVYDKETGKSYVVSRSSVAKDLQKPLISILKKQGITEEDAAIKASTYKDLESINKDFDNRFEPSMYIRDYDVTEDVEAECLKYIQDKIKVWHWLEKNEWKDITPRSFVKVSRSGTVTDDTFYCNALCGFRKKCKYIESYNLNKQNEDDLF